MPGSVAETVYGRQGGGWVTVAAAGGGSHAIRVNVPATGGPSAGSDMVVLTWGEFPGLPEEMPYPDLGRYVLVGGECAPPENRRDEYGRGETETWTTDARYVWEAA